MTFLAGGFLAGLALTALPVLIHLVIRKKRRVVPWGAMQFLVGTPPRLRFRMQKLNELLVLLLRVLAIAALVLAFAQPFIQSGLIPRGAGEHFLIIDASLSTARVVSPGRRAFDEEIAAAEKTLKSLSGSDSVRILLATDSPRWLTPTALEASSANCDALRAMLKRLQPTDGSCDLPMAISEVLQNPAAPDRTARYITIFSDATERPWHAAEVTRWNAIKRAMTAGETASSIQADVAASAPNPEMLNNLVLTRLSVDHETIGKGDTVSLTAEIRNNSAQPSVATEMGWDLDERTFERSEVPPLDSGASTSVEVSIPSDEVGSHIIRATLAAPDDLPLDGKATVAIRVMDEVPLLVVDGGRDVNSDAPVESGFFLAALGYVPGASARIEGQAAFRPKVIGPAELTNVPLDPFFCIVLADLERLDLSQATRLATQVAAGSGLWIALGDRVDIASFNKVFASAGVGLSPVKLGPLTGEVSDSAPGWRILPPTEPHPATILLRDGAQLDLDRARVQRHHTLLPPIPPSVTTLLALETQAPFVIEHSFGKGRVFIQFSPLDRSWNNLPILHTYVPMVRDFLWRLAEGRVSGRNVLAGETLRLAVSEHAATPFTVFLPDGERFSGNSTEGQIRFSGTFLPGVYRVESGGQQPEHFCVPRPAEESDLTPLSAATQQFLREHAVIFADAKSVVKAGDVRARKSITPILLGMALCLFLLEALLTRYFAHQRMVRHGPVVLKPVTMR